MRAITAIVIGLVACSAPANAASCPGNPNALGTSRVLTIDPAEYAKIGTQQYPDTLPLEPKEVVLTFDDGPMPPYTNRVLEALAADCVKANYFIIGRMARGYPELLRRIHAEGHVIGTHSENHPLAFEKMPLPEVRTEIDTGIASVSAALRVPNGVAPFFRIPGLLRSRAVEQHLGSRGIAVWSADVTGDDWKHVTANDVVNRVMGRLDERGRGVVLLHDIQPATALALPELLRRLRKGGYRIVQVAPGKAIPVAKAPPTPPITPPVTPAPVASAPAPATLRAAPAPYAQAIKTEETLKPETPEPVRQTAVPNASPGEPLRIKAAVGPRPPSPAPTPRPAPAIAVVPDVVLKPEIARTSTLEVPEAAASAQASANGPTEPAVERLAMPEPDTPVPSLPAVVPDAVAHSQPVLWARPLAPETKSAQGEEMPSDKLMILPQAPSPQAKNERFQTPWPMTAAGIAAIGAR